MLHKLATKNVPLTLLIACRDFGSALLNLGLTSNGVKDSKGCRGSTHRVKRNLARRTHQAQQEMVCRQNQAHSYTVSKALSPQAIEWREPVGLQEELERWEQQMSRVAGSMP